MTAKKLNVGCGTRFSPEWTNIDFHSEDRHVQRVNLMRGIPFADGTFQAVYSSHVLEHFDRKQGKTLLKESFRVLQPGGILRVAVPDLEGTCAEYMRIIQLPDNPEKKRLYAWVIVELLDQMVRHKPGGDMGPLMDDVLTGNDEQFKAYVRSRTVNCDPQPTVAPGLITKLGRLTPEKVSTKLTYLYLKAVSSLVPRSLRDMIFVQTNVGERHRWMYDEYGLRVVLEELGFRSIHRVAYDQSAIPSFNSFHLDCNPDGQAYRSNTLYMEAVRP